MNLPSTFSTSYQNHQQYPCNLVDSSPGATILSLCHTRLNNSAPLLCSDSVSSRLEVNFRDFHVGQIDCDKQFVNTDERLAKWLHQIDQTAPLAANDSITKSDPHCRFVFFTAPNGRAKLSASQDMLTRLLTYHQVPIEYVNSLMILFGQREGSSDLNYRSFWHKLSFGLPVTALEISSLGRSGRHYEMCFNLKGVEETKLADPDIEDVNKWSIRHAAVYHKFDVNTGKAVWYITQAGHRLRQCIKDATNDPQRREATSFDEPTVAYRSSLEAHLILSQWASQSWWTYLQDLETALEEKTKDALLVESGSEATSKRQTKLFTRSHLQDVLFYEEKCQLVASVLQGNIDILNSIREHYDSLLTKPNFSLANDVTLQTQNFCKDLQSVAFEMQAIKTRAETLVAHARSRKNLIVQLLQAQTSDSMTSMTRRSIEEAMAMRVITVVTVVYLPATFVSTFFSTDVVKYQPGGGENETYHTQYSSLALRRWFEVAIPLTIITLISAIGAYVWARRPLRKAEMEAKNVV